MKNQPAPPRFALRLLEWTAPGSDLDCMRGDLEEEFERRRVHGHTQARLWYWRQVLRSTPANLRRRYNEEHAWQRAHPNLYEGDTTMTSFLHDLRFAWRSVARNQRLAATIVRTAPWTKMGPASASSDASTRSALPNE